MEGKVPSLELQLACKRVQLAMIATAEALRPAFRAFMRAGRMLMSNRRIRRAWKSGRVERAVWLIEDRRRRIMREGEVEPWTES